MLVDAEIFLRVSFFICGALIGSFLNVCIVRLPRSQSIVFPASHCPKCKKPIAWFDNIPIISYLLLRAKCRACRTHIPFRYFFVEHFTAIIFMWTYVLLGLSWSIIPALILLSGLIVASWVDIEWRIIPDEISVGGIAVGLLVSALIPGLHKGPATEVLLTGSTVSLILAGSCMGLHLIKILRRKLPFEREDKEIFAVGLTLLALQWTALVAARMIPGLAVYLSALADAFQGVIVGACSLWVTGLLGEVIITKRIVTEFDFKGIVDDPLALLADLQAHSYIDALGNLQPAFREVKVVGNLKLGHAFEPKRKDIFEMLYAVDEGGVMGWGDVKLLAMAGAFLGWQLACVAFFVAPFFGAVAGLVKMLRKQDTAIAYGPFLAMGIVVSLFWGDKVIRWVLQMYSIS